MLADLGELMHGLGKLITDFGPFVFGLVALLLIIVLMFIVLIYLAKAISKSLTQQGQNNNSNAGDVNEQLRAMREEIASLRGGCGNFQSKKEENLMAAFLRINNGLKHTVRELVPKIKADRVAFYLFHNGTHSINNIPFLKASCLCEIDDLGLAQYHLVKSHKDIPINLLDDIVVELIKKHDFVIYKNEKKVDALIAKLFFDEQDKTCIFSGIFEMDSGELLGFIVAEYDNVTEFTENDLKYRLENMRETAKHTSATMQIISALK